MLTKDQKLARTYGAGSIALAREKSSTLLAALRIDSQFTRMRTSQRRRVIEALVVSIRRIAIGMSVAPTGLEDSITFVIAGCRAARFTLGYFISRFQRDEVVCGRVARVVRGLPDGRE